MNSEDRDLASNNRDGHLALPEQFIKEYMSDDRLLIARCPEGILILPPFKQLKKLYTEPTNLCNLNCLTCMRNCWAEKSGFMSSEVFNAILNGLAEFYPVPTVFLRGFGEPLMHPEIIDMVKRLNDLGSRVEMITNGILLSKEISESLIHTGISTL